MSNAIQDLAEAAERNDYWHRMKEETANDVRYELSLARFSSQDVELALDVARMRQPHTIEHDGMKAIVFFDGQGYHVTTYSEV